MDVAVGLGSDCHLQIASDPVRGVGVIAPGIPVDAAGPRAHTGHPQRNGIWQGQEPGRVQPVDHGRIVLDALHQTGERLRGGGHRGLDRACLFGR